MNLQFENLLGVIPPEPMQPIRYEKRGDIRSVTFDSGIGISFSDFMSSTFKDFLSVSKEDWKGATWLKEAWETTLDVINSQHLSVAQGNQVVLFILGNADHIFLYVNN